MSLVLTNQQSFFGLTALYWLVKTVSPFGLTVVALTSVYAAPLVTSARGRGIAREAGTRVQELATTATENGRVVAHDASVGVQQLVSTATETGRGFAHDASVGVESLVNTTTKTGRAAASGISAGAQESLDAATEGNVLAQKGKDEVTDLSEQARGTFSHISGAAAGNIEQVQQIGLDAVHQTSDAVGLANTNANKNASSHLSNDIDRVSIRNFDGDQTAPRGAANRVPDASHSQTKPSVDAHQQPSVASSKPVYTGAAVTGTGAHRGGVYTTAGDEAVAQSVLERPRGTAYPAWNKAS
jgi:hypothetical protein